VVMWVVVGGGLIVVCRCGSVCNQIKVHTRGCSHGYVLVMFHHLSLLFNCYSLKGVCYNIKMMK